MLHIYRIEIWCEDFSGSWDLKLSKYKHLLFVDPWLWRSMAVLPPAAMLPPRNRVLYKVKKSFSEILALLCIQIWFGSALSSSLFVLLTSYSFRIHLKLKSSSSKSITYVTKMFSDPVKKILSAVNHGPSGEDHSQETIRSLYRSLRFGHSQVQL